MGGGGPGVESASGVEGPEGVVGSDEDELIGEVASSSHESGGTPDFEFGDFEDPVGDIERFLREEPIPKGSSFHIVGP